MWLYRVNAAVGQLVRPYWRLGLTGAVEAIPREGPLIVAANHQSYLDPWFIGIVFPRPIRYLINSEWYHRSPLWRALFRAWGTEPVRSRSRETIEAVCGILRRGEVVGIFPEGRISLDGRLQPFRPGLARIAALSGAPVLPVAIRGAYEAFPKTARVPRPREVKVHVGVPLVFEGAPWPTPPPRELAERFRTRVFEEIRRLAGQSGPASAPTLRWAPAAPPAGGGGAPRPSRQARPPARGDR
ncbi:MAG: 1-acyl-sn-glycerol-3-phosphate acyltransferase [Acidobacteria bacterium]|nr:MAG: 1-acyl-sn-glycerol-3-phosphate acyltransferase [Acidobacteriota bacterium]